MIQRRTMLKIADNSGALSILVIGILRGSKRRYASLGDVVIGTVKKAIAGREIKKHAIVRAIIVRTKKEVKRKDGTYVRFDDNAGVIIDSKSNEPVGKKIFGPIAREVREKGFEKVANLAREIV